MIGSLLLYLLGMYPMYIGAKARRAEEGFDRLQLIDYGYFLLWPLFALWVVISDAVDVVFPKDGEDE